MWTVVLLAAVQVVSFAVVVALIWGAARIVKAPRATWRRALVGGIVLTVAAVLTLVLLAVLADAGALWRATGAAVAIAVADVGYLPMAFRRLFGVPWGRAGSMVVIVGVAINIVEIPGMLLLRSYVVDAMVYQTNPVAPTLRGLHQRDVCADCGGTLVVAVDLDAVRAGRAIPQPGICERCFHVTMTPRGQKSMSDGGMKLEPPDRAIVNKLMRPRRWDVVAFRSVAPSDVGALRWSRLVGLPGETVFVEDGGVWVNDQKMTLPTELAGLKYGMRRMDLTRLMGTRERPWRLGPDECCLLGDFSEISFDSRFYGAVPMRNVQGVVTLRYWPMSRVHVFR